MAKPAVRYLVFDVETVADGDLVAAIRYPEETLGAEEAIVRYREELMEQYQRDFIPYTFQVPISVAACQGVERFPTDRSCGS